MAGGKPAGAVNSATEGPAFFGELVEAIFPLSEPAARTLATALGIAAAEGPVSVLDLGAGAGVWGIAMAQASPRVTVRAVDWPALLAVTRRAAERFGVGEHFTLVAGDLPDADLGTGHQVATIGHILHSAGADRAKALLRRTRTAPGRRPTVNGSPMTPTSMGPGGRWRPVRSMMAFRRRLAPSCCAIGRAATPWRCGRAAGHPTGARDLRPGCAAAQNFENSP